MADQLSLFVNGREFAGWKNVRVTAGIESIAGSFDLGVTDRWDGRDVPWDIVEEDECRVAINGESVIKGWVDKRTISISGEMDTLTLSGRDFTGALVDCSALLNDNGSGKIKKKATWEFANTPLLTLVKRLAEVHGISVALDPPDLQLPPPAKKLAIEPGDTMFDVIDRACKLVGVLPIADGNGGLLLMRPGAKRAHNALVQGENILSGTANYDASARFRKYVVHGQHPGSDNWFGETAAGVSAEAQDLNVRRAARTLLIKADNAVTPAYAKARAAWEATVRAARSNSITITTTDWLQSNGAIWRRNEIVPVFAPRLGVDGDLLISEITYSLDETGGELTTFTLKPPDAFKPSPLLKEGADRGWKELKAFGKSKAAGGV